MTRFLLLSILLWSCVDHKQSKAPENSLSMILYSDSAIIYTGKLKKESFQKIALDETSVKNILAKEKETIGKDLIVLLKLSNEGLNGSFMDNAINLNKWSAESGINDIRFSDMDEKDVAVFNLTAVPWSIIDSIYQYEQQPQQLNLNLPKEDETENSIVWPENKKITALIVNDSIYCYKGNDLKGGAFYSISKNTYRPYLKRTAKEIGDSLLVTLKLLPDASYKNTIDMLDEMQINNIAKYKMVKITDEEISFLGTKK